MDNFHWSSLWITLKNSVLYQNILVQITLPEPSFFKDIDMQIFSVAQLLITNAYEFCPEAIVSPEWQRLVYEEIYHQWLRDEVTTITCVEFIEQRYEAFMLQLIDAVTLLTPVFKANNIDLHGGQYRVRVLVDGHRVTQCFDTLNDARRVRDELLSFQELYATA